jgi:hypothetical protein
VTLRDPRVTLIEGLTLADEQGLEALRTDRDECGPGLTLGELQHTTGRRHLKGFFARLHAEGYLVGETADGRFQLGHTERTTGGSTGTAVPRAGAQEPIAGASPDRALTLFERGGRKPAPPRGTDARGLLDAA